MSRLTPPPAFQETISRILAVGHSYLAGGGASALDRSFASQLGAVMGADVTSFGVGASCIGLDENGTGKGGWAAVLQEPSFTAKNRTGAPRQPNGFMGLVWSGGNDAFQHHADASSGFTDWRTVLKNGLRTTLARLSTSQLYEDTDSSIAYAGATWQSAVTLDALNTALGAPWVTNLAPSAWNSGTSYRPFPANSATITITIPSDFEGGYIDVGFIAWPNSDAVITWSGTCSAATGTTTLVGQAYNSAGAGAQRSSPVGVVKRFLCVASDATKTIIGTVGSMTTTAGAVPSAPGTITHGGTTGAATYTYAWVDVYYNGDTVKSTTTSTTNGNATLTGTNTNIIPAPGAFGTGVLAKRLIRTATSGASGNGATLGLIATITSNVAVTDVGLLAASYTSPTAGPILTGGAFDYWAIEATNPSTGIIAAGHPRFLPGTIPLVGGTGGYGAGGGYVGGPAFGTTAITAGGGVAATTVTVNYAGLTTAQQAYLIVGGIVNLTGGANPTEAFYINAINTGTGVITLSTSPSAQVGAVTQSGHTTVGYGYAQDADVLNLNSDIQTVVNEFTSYVKYADIDSVINQDQTHYFSDGVHLNDRGWSMAADSIAKIYATLINGLQPFQIAAMGRSRRRPENFVTFKRSYNSVPFITDVLLNSVTWANVTDNNGTLVALSIGAKVGDFLEISLSGLLGNQAVVTLMDVATMLNSTTPINYCGVDSPTPANGVGTWTGLTSLYGPLSGSIMYQVKPADLITLFTVPNVVLLQLRYINSAATNRTLYMSYYPLVFTVKNLGQPATFAGSP